VSGPQRVHYGPRRAQFGELWRPETVDPRPVVVLFHGGYWRARYTRRLMHALARDVVRRGFVAWNVEYRRVGPGGGGGGWPTTYDDARLALAAVRGLEGADPTRVATCGHSAGGHLALWTAADAARATPPSGSDPHDDVVVPLLAVSLAGVVDVVAGAAQGLGHGAIERLMGGLPADQPEAYHRASLLAGLPLGVPQVVLHGALDDVVPPRMSEDYAARAVAAGDEAALVLVDGVDHMDVIDPASPGWEAAAGHLGRALGGTASGS
jgi:acetyl esterase/lipase